MGFGDFEGICRKAAVPLCSVVGPPSSITGSASIEPDCYSRSIELANTIIFSGATDAMHIVALLMTAIMIIHVRSKFTAVGELGKASECAAQRDRCNLTAVFRSEGNHHFLLHLHAPYDVVSDS